VIRVDLSDQSWFLPQRNGAAALEESRSFSKFVLRGKDLQVSRYERN